MAVKQKRPPRQTRDGKKEPVLSPLAVQRIATHAGFGLRRCDVQSHLPSQNPGNKPAHRVCLPSSGSHQIGPCSSAGPLQQIEKLGSFASLARGAGIFDRLRRLLALVRFLGWDSLFGRLCPRWRHVGRSSRDTRAFGGRWLGRRGQGFGILGHFLEHRSF